MQNDHYTFQICACGKCNKLVLPGKKYVHGHNPSWNKNKRGLQVSWCKGLTKETDERVAKISKSQIGIPKSEEHKRKVSETKMKEHPKPDPKPCECNCGEYAKPGNRFVNGHGCRGKKFIRTAQHKINQKLGMEEAKADGKQIGRKKGSVPCNKGKKGLQISWSKGQTKETNTSIASISKKMTGKAKTEEHKRKLALVNLGKKELEETRKKKSIANKGKKHGPNGPLSEEHKMNIGLGVLENLDHNPITRTKLRNNSIKYWQDPEWKARQLIAIGKGLCILPNRPETLIDIITYEYWTGWKYTGDYSVVINGKNPDFINEETKQIIEVYGDYWHDGEDPTDRAEIFAEAGYETCVIWESELNNLDHIICKLRRFMNGGIY